MEPDLRAADRDLREIQALDKRGVAGAGKLGGGFTTSRASEQFDTPTFTHRRRTRTTASEIGGVD